MCNAQVDDKFFIKLLDTLSKSNNNNSVNEIWMESNPIGDQGMLRLAEFIKNDDKITTIKLYNNIKTISTKVLNEIVDAMEHNTTITKFVFDGFRFSHQKDKIEKYLRRNGDILRKKRREQKLLQQQSSNNSNNVSGSINGNSNANASTFNANKELNREITNSFGKELTKINTTDKLSNKYKGKIPNVLYLLDLKLNSLNGYQKRGIFLSETIEQNKDDDAYIIGNNIISFFAKLKKPLLSHVDQSILMKAINKDAMEGVCNEINEPHSSVLIYLFDICAKVASNESRTGLGPEQLGRIFGPMTLLITKKDVRGNRVNSNALAASRMVAFFRRGIEWRLESKLYI